MFFTKHHQMHCLKPKMFKVNPPCPIHKICSFRGWQLHLELPGSAICAVCVKLHCSDFDIFSNF